MDKNYPMLFRKTFKVDKNYPFCKTESNFDAICVKAYVCFFDSIRYLFYKGSPHICLCIRTALAAKIAPNKPPPAMCSRKNAGSTKSFSQTDAGEILKRNIDKSTIRVKKYLDSYLDFI